ncbi:hypothetical protein [Nocardia asteroides]|uniref:hypothetical protein n=1 Tax=Nocardia asteroides TaxID=1824 RepID=UPI0009457F91|nr:hypothetical protein [Nocardia asteroides]TLF67455.1 hypothetical protein FEK33_16040 [Nocardia asteroides NBRC 15531]UGT51055.1 hypothetical protein LT345_11180 [Nocardia asteroides]
MSATVPGQVRWRASWGVAAGLFVAVFVLVPATFAVQDAWRIPMPRTVAFAEIEPIPTAYWLSWALTLAVLLAPALVLALLPVARLIVLGYLLTTTAVGVVLCATTVGLAFSGLDPA